MNRKKGFPKLFKKLGIYAFWLLVWQLLAVFFHNDILLVGPSKTLRTFFSCLITAGFWRSIWFSISRICIGFFLAMLLGILTGALSCRFRIVGGFLAPPIQFMKSIPVASFVILALIWTGSKNLSILISFLVAYPILHISTVSGLKSTASKLLEMAQVFRVPFHKKIFYLYRPALSPYLISACKSALGPASPPRSSASPTFPSVQTSMKQKFISTRLLCLPGRSRSFLSPPVLKKFCSGS